MGHRNGSKRYQVPFKPNLSNPNVNIKCLILFATSNDIKFSINEEEVKILMWVNSSYSKTENYII